MTLELGKEFLVKTLKAQSIKKKKKLSSRLHQNQAFILQKTLKKETSHSLRIFANHVSDVGLVFRLCKNFYNSVITIQLKTEQHI